MMVRRPTHQVTVAEDPVEVGVWLVTCADPACYLKDVKLGRKAGAVSLAATHEAIQAARQQATALNGVMVAVVLAAIVLAFLVGYTFGALT